MTSHPELFPAPIHYLQTYLQVTYLPSPTLLDPFQVSLLLSWGWKWVGVLIIQYKAKTVLNWPCQLELNLAKWKYTHLDAHKKRYFWKSGTSPLGFQKSQIENGTFLKKEKNIPLPHPGHYPKFSDFSLVMPPLIRICVNVEFSWTLSTGNYLGKTQYIS